MVYTLCNDPTFAKTHVVFESDIIVCGLQQYKQTSLLVYLTNISIRINSNDTNDVTDNDVRQ
jgi:hypothetical protein